ncbi:VCBS repeat protein [Yoonia maricola]|uniref:VCBS repeat protein n=1 Tax=Yoonia maricola TaxID=420999 RepID=A0A2M8WJZ6_9RHOB|nr:VCBS repeat-containing protein [Yoonia maricola]PJI91255.1 VCBS repeat protein [Yoonia maricola]
MATSACAETIVSAEYTSPTDRYAHGVLGDAIEWGELQITTDADLHRFVLPQDRVFEDIAPRLADVDRDGTPEVVVVETLASAGAQIAIYDETGKIAATPHIGQTNRWLAPIGVADLDGDGVIEIAYIDRPHLAKTLRVWRFADGALTPVADLPGLTNHRIGERDIGGGIRDCGQGPELVTANADWTKVMVTTLENGQLQTRAIGTHVDRSSFDIALACDTLP